MFACRRRAQGRDCKVDAVAGEGDRIHVAFDHHELVDVPERLKERDRGVVTAELEARAHGRRVVPILDVGDIRGAVDLAIAEARGRGIPVVISSRVYTGRLMPLYAGKGKGVDLRALGCVLSDNLSPQKARILLMVALTRTSDPDELQRLFDH